MLSPDPAAVGVPKGSGRLGSVNAYLAAVGISVLAILSQYFVPELVPATLPLYASFAGGLLVVYGIPIVAFLVLVGTRPLLRWRHATLRSSVPALGWYGALSLLSLLVIFLLTIVYLILDPGALDLLSRTNPVLESAASDPWFWVAFSFAVGAIEETIFRGWIFGYWLARGSRNTFVHAVWTSLLFAGIHLYYGTTYGAAAPLVYPELFFLGLAFALAVRASGGNLVWVAILHGANDATAFLTLVNYDAALALHYGVILLGALVALIAWLRSRAPAPLPPFAAAGADATAYGGPPPAGYAPLALSVRPPPSPPPPGPPPPPPIPPPPG